MTGVTRRGCPGSREEPGRGGDDERGSHQRGRVDRVIEQQHIEEQREDDLREPND